MKLLVATSNELQYRLYETLLQDSNWETCSAYGEKAAIELAEQTGPDLIILDVEAENLNAMQLGMRLKAHEHSVFTPLIFLLGRDQSERISECYVAGADDVLVKPILANVLRAKVNAQGRTKQLNKRLDQERQELEHYRHYREYEDEVAHRLMDNARAKSLQQCANVASYERAAANFSGDMFLSGISPRGNLYVLIGDTTGHGLPSSIATLPVSQVFFAMVRKGLGVAEMAAEINAAMHRFLPDDMFVAASIFQLQADGQRLTAWCGGLPDALLIQPNGDLRKRIVSDHMPLGAEEDHEFARDLQMIALEPGDRLLVYSDGAQELFNEAGDLLEQDRFEALVQASYLPSQDGTALDRLIGSLEGYLGDEEPHDDITLVEISQGPVDATQHIESYGRGLTLSPAWQLRLELGPREIRDADPVLQLVEMLSQSPGLAAYGDVVFTIVSEMYTNALDHGVLGLDSALKHDEEGFLEYYSLKSERIDALDRGLILLEAEFDPGERDGTLKLKIEDSGPGFDYAARDMSVMDDDEAHGRGIPLMLSLCTRVEYSMGGRRLEVHLPVHL